MDMLEEALPRALGWTLAHFLWQGVVIGALLWALLRYGGVRSASARYLVGCFALLLCITVASITFVLEYRGAQQTRSSRGVVTAPQEPRPSHTMPEPQADPSIIPAPEPGGVKVGSASPAPAGSAASSASARWMEPLLPWLVIMWGTGVLLLSVRLMGGWAFTQHLKHRLLRPVPDWLVEMFSRLRENLGIYKLVRVFESAAVESPLVIGWLKPVVLLPACAITGLSEEQLRTILAHELAHVRRHDYLINLIQSLAETALFFHPAVWWMSARVRDERENCCDDIAIAACGHELEYAEALAALAEQRQHTAQFALSATGGSLFGRIQRILAGTGPAVPVSRPAAALAGVLMISLLVTVVAQAYMLREQRQATPPTSIFADASKGYPERYRRPVTMTWVKAPLRNITASITTQTGLVVPLPAGTEEETFTVRFDNAPLHMVLDAVLNRARIGWRLVGNDQIVTTPWNSRDIWISRWQNEAAGRELEKDIYQAGYCSILYAAKDARLADVMQIVGAQMGCRITVPEAERGRLLSFNFHETFARDALSQLLSPLGLDYRLLSEAEIEIFRP